MNQGRRLVVSNTGPIIALSLIRKLDLLPALFSECVVSDQVHREILAGGPRGAGVTTYQKAPWIKVATLSRPLEPLLRSFLHDGESSAIQLAVELSSDCVLMDEQKARKVAREIYGLKVMGSIRVLLEAKRRKLLKRIRPSLQALRDHGYWFADDIVAAALQEAGE